MRFGVCCGLEEAPMAVRLGYDYVELGASSIAASEDLAPFRELPIAATNLFFPGGFSLYGDDANAFREYAPRTIEKVASLGVTIMVVGSGGARNMLLPELTRLRVKSDSSTSFASFSLLPMGTASRWRRNRSIGLRPTSATT